jgi:hypothetical protein
MRQLDQIGNVLNARCPFKRHITLGQIHKQLKAIQPRLVSGVPFNGCERDLLIGKTVPMQKGNIHD